MSWSVTVGLMILRTVTCCPCLSPACVFAPTAGVRPLNAVTKTTPATNAAAHPAPVTLLFIVIVVSSLYAAGRLCSATSVPERNCAHEFSALFSGAALALSLLHSASARSRILLGNLQRARYQPAT